MRITPFNHETAGLTRVYTKAFAHDDARLPKMRKEKQNKSRCVQRQCRFIFPNRKQYRTRIESHPIIRLITMNPPLQFHSSGDARKSGHFVLLPRRRNFSARLSSSCISSHPISTFVHLHRCTKFLSRRKPFANNGHVIVVNPWNSQSVPSLTARSIDLI